MFRVETQGNLRHFKLMTNDPYHYGVIERAIAHIENTANAQPSLDSVAAAVGLSPAHFQRVFSQWAGVSPKKYLQYLTLNHAKSMLDERFTVLDTALQSGLSGSGRLHDLFLSWEAMSPGEYSRKGAGLTIYFGWFDTHFGPALVMGTTRGICGLAFGAEFGEQATFGDMISRWPNAEFVENTDHLRPWVNNIMAMQGKTNLHLIGAPFQIKVWEALLRVPSGQVTTYGEIANHIGNPKAVRAVGTAVGSNPISWLIPCHRALRKSGGLGGYHWGLPVKRAMLAWESARFDSAENP